MAISHQNTRLRQLNSDRVKKTASETITTGQYPARIHHSDAANAHTKAPALCNALSEPLNLGALPTSANPTPANSGINWNHLPSDTSNITAMTVIPVAAHQP